jgi:hypothetical protein
VKLELIIALIQQIIVPEVAEIIRRRQAANLPITDADIMAELAQRMTDVVSTGTAWLAAHPA